MNINPQIMALSKVTGLSVTPDLYEGNDEQYITFTYADERPEAFGDDAPIADTVWVYVQYTAPYKFNYFKMKQTILDYLESIGTVQDIRTLVEKDSARKVRTVSFEVEISEGRE